MLAVTNAGFCVSLQNEIGHPADCHRRLIKVPELRAHGILIGSKHVIGHYYSKENCVLSFVVKKKKNCGFYDL